MIKVKMSVNKNTLFFSKFLPLSFVFCLYFSSPRNYLLLFGLSNRWFDNLLHLESLQCDFLSCDHLQLCIYNNQDQFLRMHNWKTCLGFWNLTLILTLTCPLRRKLRMRWFFDVSKVKESSFFFKSDLTDPPQIFDAHLLEITNFSPSGPEFRLSFFSGFLYQNRFWVRWSYSFFERMRLKRKNDVYSH